MKKIFHVLYAVIFFAICLIPLIAFPFVQKGSDIEKTGSVSSPKLFTSAGINTNFSNDCESWVNSNFPFRTSLISASDYIKTELLGTPASNVIAGKEGYIYSTTTADNYIDNNALSDTEISSIVVTLSLIQENVTAKGGKFLFIPMPNKNEIYPEYMPDSYKKAASNDLSRLTAKLSSSDVNYLDMKSVLLETKANNTINIFYKRDTHWNAIGAYAGFCAIVSKMGIVAKDYGSSYTVTKNYRGDLDKLLYPEGGIYDEQVNFDYSIDEFTFTDPAGVTDTAAQLANFMSDKEENDTRFTTVKTNPTNNSKLYMVRDSFGRALLPYMIDTYSTATFIRSKNPSIEAVKADTDMIYEIVERNLSDLISTAPYMKAPKREITVEYQYAESNRRNTCFISDEGYAVRIYGTIDKNMLDSDGRIYVQLSNGSETYTVEAFPIYESELLKDKDVISDVGYSLFLDSSELAAGEYSVSAVSGKTSTGKMASYTKQ